MQIFFPRHLPEQIPLPLLNNNIFHSSTNGSAACTTLQYRLARCGAYRYPAFCICENNLWVWLGIIKPDPHTILARFIRIREDPHPITDRKLCYDLGVARLPFAHLRSVDNFITFVCIRILIRGNVELLQRLRQQKWTAGQNQDDKAPRSQKANEPKSQRNPNLIESNGLGTGKGRPHGPDLRIWASDGLQIRLKES